MESLGTTAGGENTEECSKDVKTNENPAYIGTREKSLKLFHENVWRYRKKFLYNNESEWPSQF